MDNTQQTNAEPWTDGTNTHMDINKEQVRTIRIHKTKEWELELRWWQKKNMIET